MTSPVLCAAPLPAMLVTDLVERYDARDVPAPGEAGRSEALSAAGRHARVAVTTARYGITADDLAALPALEAVVGFGAGTDAIDLEAAASRGIAVSTTPDVLTDAVADLAVGLVLDVLRGITAADRRTRAGRWPIDGPPPLARQVTGRRVGILGLGRIGQGVADRLAGFRCEIGYHNRRRHPSIPYPYLESPADLAQWCDVLVVTAPGGDTVLVDAEVLDRLGPDGVLVNVGRGSIVDEPALVAALERGGIAGAGLDVFADEPHVPEALVARDDVVLVPHIGSATVETRRRMADLVLANVDSWLRTGTLVTPLLA